MSNIVIVCPYQEAHVTPDILFPNFQYTMEQCTDCFTAANMITFSIFKKGILLAVVPVYYIREYVAEGMVYVTQYASTYTRSVVEGLRIIAENAKRLLEVRRLQVAVEVGNKPALKLILAVGFEYETILKQYSDNDKDCYLLARFY